MADDTNIKKGANTAMSLSPLLKEVYPEAPKKKGRSKRYGRISRMMHTPKTKA